MKKLIVATIAVAFAAVTQAASFAWDNGDGDLFVSSGAGTTASGYIVYLLDAGVTSTAAAQTAFAAGDFSALASGWEADDLADGGWVESSGTPGFTAGTSYNFYLAAFDADTAAGASNFYLSDVVAVSFPGSGLPGTASFDLSGSASAGAWTATAVPEPTSGLLLLLGMAGLALKRKRA